MVESKKIIILLIILGFVLFFCKKNIPMKKELSKHNGQVNFSLNNTDYKKRPVVTIEDSGVIFYFVVDTGCTQSYVNENFCKKINLSPEEYDNFEGGIVTLCIEDSRYLIDGKEHILKMPVKKIEVFIEKEIDGLLGIDFLSQYENVVFDYKRKKINFNQSAISKYPINMYKNMSDIFYIYYSLDGIKDYGLLDTGCDSFIVRENYQTDYVEFTDDEIREIRNGPNLIKKEMDRVHFNRIDIGRISYKDMYGYFAIDERIKMDATAEKEHRVRSILGYSFFKNHIIQLDFKNNLFYIE